VPGCDARVWRFRSSLFDGISCGPRLWAAARGGQAYAKTKTVTVSVHCAAWKVYDVASNPENMPKWANAFCLSIKKSGNDWVITTPMGEMKARFVPQNSVSVLDHFVSPKPSVEIYVSTRVVPNGAVSEVLFTIIQSPGRSDSQFAEDIRMIERDLNSLKRFLEAS
jgi:hypothetical protein